MFKRNLKLLSKFLKFAPNSSIIDDVILAVIARKIIKTIAITDKCCSIFDPAQLCKKYVSVSQNVLGEASGIKFLSNNHFSVQSRHKRQPRHHTLSHSARIP